MGINEHNKHNNNIHIKSSFFNCFLSVCVWVQEILMSTKYPKDNLIYKKLSSMFGQRWDSSDGLGRDPAILKVSASNTFLLSALQHNIETFASVILTRANISRFQCVPSIYLQVLREGSEISYTVGGSIPVLRLRHIDTQHR